MRAWFLGFIFMIFSPFIGVAESSIADSLLNKLEFAASDSERVLHQISLYKFYENKNGYIAMEWAQKAYELAKSIDDKNGIELSLRAIRSIAEAQKNYSELYKSNNKLEIIYRQRKVCSQTSFDG